MNILLLNPAFRVKVNNKYERFFVRAGSRWPYSEYKKINEPSLYRPFPFSLAYTAALLRNYGHTVNAIDGVALQYQNDEFLKYALQKNPDVVLIEIAPFSIHSDCEIAKQFKIKNKNTLIIAVGPFVPLLLECIENKASFDYAINGEYECAAVELIENIRAGSGINIKGIVDFSKKQPLDKQPEFTELIDPLDKLPQPLRDIFPSNECPDINAYWDVFCQLKPAVQMHTSRGCPYHCYFCLWNQVVYRENKYRTFANARVIEEMEHIVNRYKAKEIYIDDDDFTINKVRISELCQEIKNRKLKVRWSCMADAINLNDDLIGQMAEAYCIGIKFGIESADANVLSVIGKPVNLERVRQVVSACKRYAIRSHATYSFGLLNETPESLTKTLQFAKDLDTDSVQFSIATPYPGTRFYEILKTKNWIREFDWMNYDGSCKSVISYPALRSEYLEAFFSRAFSNWFYYKLKNIGWVARQIRFSLRAASSQSLLYNFRFMKRLILKVTS